MTKFSDIILRIHGSVVRFGGGDYGSGGGIVGFGIVLVAQVALAKCTFGPFVGIADTAYELQSRAGTGRVRIVTAFVDTVLAVS